LDIELTRCVKRAILVQAAASKGLSAEVIWKRLSLDEWSNDSKSAGVMSVPGV
jgi:hypothetical protein